MTNKKTKQFTLGFFVLFLTVCAQFAKPPIVHEKIYCISEPHGATPSDITVPEFEPKTEVVFAEKTYQAELVVSILATKLEPNTAAIETHFILPIERQTALVAETNWTSFALPADCFVLVTAKLMYYNTNKFTMKNYVNSKELNPACVVFACGS
jgi:hypothetical protein